MQILDGKSLALEIQEQIKQEVQMLNQRKITPGLAVILVGNDPASQSYVNMKAKACSQTGFILPRTKCQRVSRKMRFCKLF